MFLLKFILDDRSVQNSFETVQELEFTHDGIIVVKALCNNWGKSSFKFFDFLSENNEVIIELFSVDVHGIVWELSEVLNSFLELFRDLL